MTQNDTTYIAHDVYYLYIYVFLTLKYLKQMKHRDKQHVRSHFLDRINNSPPHFISNPITVSGKKNILKLILLQTVLC